MTGFDMVSDLQVSLRHFGSPAGRAAKRGNPPILGRRKRAVKPIEGTQGRYSTAARKPPPPAAYDPGPAQHEHLGLMTAE